MSEKEINSKQVVQDFYSAALKLSLDEIVDELVAALGEVKACELSQKLHERMKYTAIIRLNKSKW